tara:strand:+ start:1007 stop:1246 length:240 start_codon:yes stop_codon:yes gene_type:complete
MKCKINKIHLLLALGLIIILFFTYDSTKREGFDIKQGMGSLVGGVAKVAIGVGKGIKKAKEIKNAAVKASLTKEEMKNK